MNSRFPRYLFRLQCCIAILASPGISRADDTCCTDRAAGVLAQVNGSVITRQEIDQQIRPLLTELTKSLGRARQKQLDLLINGHLLDREANARETTTANLLQQEVVAKTATPTHEEALAFYQTHRLRFPGDFARWKDQILQHLNQTRQGEAAQTLAEELRANAEVDIYVQAPRLSDVEGDANEILAMVEGHTITRGDVDQGLTHVLSLVQQQIHGRRREALARAIEKKLIELEAEKRNMSITSILEAEVLPQVASVTEEDLVRFCTQNQNQIAADLRDPRDRDAVFRYLTTMRTRAAESEFAKRLRENASIEMYLEETPRPVYDIAVDDQPSVGDADAPHTLVVFTDFECRRCAQLHESLRLLLEQHEHRVKVVSRDFPLSQHPRAMAAAIAAEAAREQGRYWEFAQRLFEHPTKLEDQDLRIHAADLDLDLDAFDAAIQSDAVAQRVRDDRNEGLRLGIRSTPVVFLNGRPLDDHTHQGLKEALGILDEQPAYQSVLRKDF